MASSTCDTLRIYPHQPTAAVGRHLNVPLANYVKWYIFSAAPLAQIPAALDKKRRSVAKRYQTAFLATI